MSTSSFFAGPAAGRRPRGFSLIEMMVGVVIGMIGLLVIFKTVAAWDSHARSTTSGGEAEGAGSLAMFNIERDVKQGGMGIGKALSAALGCMVKGVNNGVAFSFRLAPVEIVPGAAGASDTVNVLYGNSSFFVDTTGFSSFTADKVVLASADAKHRAGFKPGDLAVATNGTVCAAPDDTTAGASLFQVTDDSNADGLTLSHATGSFTSFYPPPAPTTATYNGDTGVVFGTVTGYLFSLGPSPQHNAWTAAGNRLTRTEAISGAGGVAISEGVVSLKAQYGYDADANNQVTDTEWMTTLPTPVDWTKVRAVRLAVLVRSRQYETSADPSATGANVPVTPNVPTWSGSAGTGANPGNPFVMTNVDGTADGGAGSPGPNNWRYYRYRVYEKEIPLRNMIWGTAP